MGLTFTEMDISAERSSHSSLRVRFLIDSGAEYSVVPEGILRRLGAEPYRSVDIILADGSVIHRSVGDIYFSYAGERAPAPVIFGQEDDEALLGAVTLESLGFMLDPLQRRIIKRRALRG